MAERNKSTEAIILTVRESGENNRQVCGLSPETGIFYATLYGGPKSKIRASVQPFNCGTIYLYSDPAKKTTKISDFDVKFWHLEYRESLYKIWAASFASEILLKTNCAGDWEKSFNLLKGFTRGLDLASEEDSKLGTLRFIWRYAELLGQQCNSSECISCGRPTANFAPDSIFVPSHNLEGFLCPDCTSSGSDSNSFFALSRESLLYLEAMNNLSPMEVRKIQISKKSAMELKQFLFYLIEKLCGKNLSTLETGKSIL